MKTYKFCGSDLWLAQRSDGFWSPDGLSTMAVLSARETLTILTYLSWAPSLRCWMNKSNAKVIVVWCSCGKQQSCRGPLGVSNETFRKIDHLKAAAIQNQWQ